MQWYYRLNYTFPTVQSLTFVGYKRWTLFLIVLIINLCFQLTINGQRFCQIFVSISPKLILSQLSFRPQLILYRQPKYFLY